MLVLLAVGTVFLAERMPQLREALPWLPHVPGLGAGKTADNASATGEGGGRRRGQRNGRAGGRGGEAAGPTPVLIASARYADLPVTTDVLGTVQATNVVTVKSQVDGKLIGIDFTDGQDVKKGDILARVDPAPFQAAYDQALAKKAQDESVLANAQVDFTRYQKLAETQYGSHQQADTQKALVTQTQAIVQGDQAAIDNARTTLNYATIRSPIDGRTGIRLIDAGNIVHASDATGIVTVAQVAPIAVVFNLPQQYLGAVNAAIRKGPLRSEALDGSSREIIDTGVLQVVDNTIDQTTGTVKLKGSFTNDRLQLWPGQFVTVRLYIDTLTHVVVVPTTAIQRGPDGTFVYEVTGDTVAIRKVTVGRQTEADSVVTAGLAVPASVVTTGFTRLTDGAKVAVSAVTASAGAPDTLAAPADAGASKGQADTVGQQGAPPAGQAAGSAPSSGTSEDNQAVRGGAAAGDQPANNGERRHRRNRGANPGGAQPTAGSGG